MIKKIFIALIIILLIAFLSWYFIFRDTSVPLVAENPSGDLPFGSGEGLNLLTTDEQRLTAEEKIFNEQSVPISELFPLSEQPIAGAVVFTRGQLSAARYVDRATGHVYEVILPAGAPSTPLVKTKISNNTRPKIYEALFRSDGSAVLLRSLKNDSDAIENLSVTLATSTVSTNSPQAAAALLRGNIDEVTSSGSTLYYSFRDSGLIVSSAFDGAGLKTITDTGFSGWRLSTSGTRLVIYPKASANETGYAYSLSSSGALTKLLGPLNALTAIINASGSRIAYSYVESGQAKLSVKNLQSGAVSEILPVSLAEKCLWSTKAAGLLFCASPVDGIGPDEPDNWYRGRTSFSDRLWLFDTNSDIAQVLAEPKARFGIDLDAVELRLSPNEDYLVFTNKRDLSLWALKLEPF